MQSIGANKWPSCGGANGSIRFDPEMGHAANAGLPNAVFFLEPIKAKFPDIGYADLFQLASATAVEVSFHTIVDPPCHQLPTCPLLLHLIVYIARNVHDTRHAKE